MTGNSTGNALSHQWQLEVGGQWQLEVGGQWQLIEHDHVIEAHYCHPGARGITLHTTTGKLFIDFDALQTDDSSIAVRRRCFLSPGQTEDLGWFFRGDRLWTEFGSQSPDGSRSSVSSRDVEQQFRLNPAGGVSFSVGPVDYFLDFPTMTQTNLATRTTRKVRRRPKCPAPTGGPFAASAPAPPTQPLAPPPGPAPLQVTWEFLGNEGVWTEYQPHVSSCSSSDIEAAFQTGTDQLTFTAGRHTYTLHLTGMFQINNHYKTKRKVRRTEHSSRAAALPRWQFQDVDGRWRDYVQGNGGCSVSSEDVERRYQDDPAASLDFTTGRFNYELSLSAMTQRNLSTNTVRPVRRLHP